MLEISELRLTLVLAKDVVQTRQGDCSRDSYMFLVAVALVFRDNGRLSWV